MKRPTKFVAPLTPEQEARLEEILKTAPGEAIRWALLSAHYRQPLDWSDESLAQAKRTLNRLYGALEKVAHLPELRFALGEGGQVRQLLTDVFRGCLRCPAR